MFYNVKTLGEGGDFHHECLCGGLHRHFCQTCVMRLCLFSNKFKINNMNGIVSFRKCTLSTIELIAKVDSQTDVMFTKQEVPTRHIPARPNEDYDLLIGELVLRVMEFEKFINVVENSLNHIEKTKEIECLSDLKKRVSLFLSQPFGEREPA